MTSVSIQHKTSYGGSKMMNQEQARITLRRFLNQRYSHQGVVFTGIEEEAVATLLVGNATEDASASTDERDPE